MNETNKLKTCPKLQPQCVNLTLQKSEKRASQGGYCLVVTNCFAVIATINICFLHNHSATSGETKE